MILDMKPRTLGVSIYAILVYAELFDEDTVLQPVRSPELLLLQVVE
jgi:hypothetical protein